MNGRTELIIRNVLAVLHSMPGNQCAEGVLKASVDLLIAPNSLQSEFRDALSIAENNNWVLGIRPRLGSVKWSLTDEGQAEHLKSK